ncbi:MAG TPA: ThiF family adenylyltransferase [Steroidobacteraceae bacterium]
MRSAAFSFSHVPLEVSQLAAGLADPSCGGYASFEGWVRNHNEGQQVTRLEYEAFEALAVKEGERIIAEAVKRFGVARAACAHRSGALGIGELAVWVGVSARHRDEAFRACRYIIDEVKHRVPIWKKEHYLSGDSGWVNCERCAQPGEAHAHAHVHPAHNDSHQAPAQARAHAATIVPDYSRQMALAAVGVRGQARLRASSVVVVGAGGLGVPVLMYLAGAGIGRLGIVDGDRLEPSNLHRQTLYALADCGELKAELAAARVRALNPDVRTTAHAQRLDASNGDALLGGYELIIDCTDNFSTKFLLNDIAVRLRKPAVFASVYQYEGQLQVVRGDLDGACLRCIWPEATRDGLVGNCAEAGVLGPVPGVFGSLQALEALKILLELPGSLRDEVLVLDLTSFALSRVRTRRYAACAPGSCVRMPAQSLGAAVAGTAVELSFESLDEALRAGLEVIDIREAREVAEMPLPIAAGRHVPLATLLHGAAALAPTARILLVCARGARSLAAADELRGRGLAAVYSLRGGVLGLVART